MIATKELKKSPYFIRNQQWRILHNERKFDAVITIEGRRLKNCKLCISEEDNDNILKLGEAKTVPATAAIQFPRVLTGLLGVKRR